MIKETTNVLDTLYPGLENGFIFVTKNDKEYEYKFFDISKLASLIFTAESEDNKIKNLKDIIESLIFLALKNYLRENYENIVCVIINLNLKLEYVAGRSDFYGFKLWSMIHKYIYDIKTGQNGKSPHPKQPKYVFCSFFDFESIKSKRKEAYIFELKGHQFLQYPFEADVLSKIEEKLKTEEFNLVCPGAYLLYSGYKLFLEGNGTNEIEYIKSKTVTYIDDKHYEWDLVLKEVFDNEIKCYGDKSYESLNEFIFMDFYLNENHKIEYLMNKDEVMKTTGASLTKEIRVKNPDKKIIMFTESSKIPYYKILEKEAKINGWYTKQTHFGENYKQKAENTFFDFLTALTD